MLRHAPFSGSLRFAVFAFAICLLANVSYAQNISYIIPDIGTPGMNSYIEIIGPYNAVGNFGKDGLYLNNPGDSVRIECANPADTQRVTFGPCVVSWSGRMISSQAFVLPGTSVSTQDWRSTNIRIPVRVVVHGAPSNVDTFYVVQPQHIGILNAPGKIGSGGAYGSRSRRGAMIVDSLILTGDGVYGMSTADCDPFTEGNQGYLPATILATGSISIGNTTKLSLDANRTEAGPGGGGGGAGGMNTAGSGFCAGGFNCASLNKLPNERTPQVSSWRIDSSLNGSPGGGSQCDQGGGGGTGHPFGLSGGHGSTYQDSPTGGYGGGSGGGELGGSSPTYHEYGGGGGANATNAISGKGSGDNSGKEIGNVMLVPVAGGSGGGGGNEYAATGGSGGSGAGSLSLYSVSSASIESMSAIGADGTSGLPDRSVLSLKDTFGCAGGGGGAGGGIIVGSHRGVAGQLQLQVDGGREGLAGDTYSYDGGSGSAGRVRVDGITRSLMVSPSGATKYFGPSTDTSSVVANPFTLSGSGNGNDIRIYIRPLTGSWLLLSTVKGYSGGAWSMPITLQGNDSVFLLAVAQAVPSPSSGAFTSEPSWVLSQAGANILHVVGCGNSSLTLSENDDVSICAEETKTIRAQPAGLRYAWMKDGQIINMSSDTLVVSDSGLYDVVLNTAPNCTDTARFKVTIVPKPNATITSQDTVFCSGSFALLSASSGRSYLWNTGETSQIIRPSKPGRYFVTVTDSNGCSATSSEVATSVRPLPDYSVTTAVDTAICADSGVVYVRSIHIQNHSSSDQKLYVEDVASDGFTRLPDSVEVLASSSVVLFDTAITDGTSRLYTASYDVVDSCNTVRKSAVLQIDARTVPISVSISLNHSSVPIRAFAGDTVILGVQVSNDLPDCITKLTFAVTHQADALTLSGVSGFGLKNTFSSRSGGLTTDLFELSPVPATIPAGTLRYRAFLSRFDSTSLNLSDVRFEDTCARAGSCITVVPSHEVSVQTVYGCGGRLIGELLKTGSLVVNDAAPNPAHNIVRIRTSAHVTTPCTVEVFNALGVAVARLYSGELASGDHTFTWDASSSPSGSYTCIFRGHDEVREVPIVIEH